MPLYKYTTEWGMKQVKNKNFWPLV